MYLDSRRLSRIGRADERGRGLPQDDGGSEEGASATDLQLPHGGALLSRKGAGKSGCRDNRSSVSSGILLYCWKS